MQRHSSHLSGCRPIESNSDKTSGFSTRKPCFTKRLAISDAPTARDHKWVVFRRVSKYAWVLGNKLQSLRWKTVFENKPAPESMGRSHRRHLHRFPASVGLRSRLLRKRRGVVDFHRAACFAGQPVAVRAGGQMAAETNLRQRILVTFSAARFIRRSTSTSVSSQSVENVEMPLRASPCKALLCSS